MDSVISRGRERTGEREPSSGHAPGSSQTAFIGGADSLWHTIERSEPKENKKNNYTHDPTSNTTHDPTSDTNGSMHEMTISIDEPRATPPPSGPPRGKAKEKAKGKEDKVRRG